MDKCIPMKLSQICKCRYKGKSDRKITYVVVEITVAVAMAFLFSQRKNRSLNDEAVKRYTRILKMGCWQLTGESVVFVNGCMINGQHRCRAVIESKKPMLVTVAYITGGEDLVDKIYNVMDTPRVRKASDVFSGDGIKYPTRVASVTRLLNQYMNDNLGRRYVVNNDELLKFFKEHPSIEDARREIVALGLKNPHDNMAAVMLFLVTEETPSMHKKMIEFFRDVNLGSGSKDNPAVVLKSYLEKTSEESGKGRAAKYIAASTIAWNAYCTGHSIDIDDLEWKSLITMPKIKHSSDTLKINQMATKITENSKVA